MDFLPGHAQIRTALWISCFGTVEFPYSFALSWNANIVIVGPKRFTVGGWNVQVVAEVSARLPGQPAVLPVLAGTAAPKHFPAGARVSVNYEPGKGLEAVHHGQANFGGHLAVVEGGERRRSRKWRCLRNLQAPTRTLQPDGQGSSQEVRHVTVCLFEHSYNYCALLHTSLHLASSLAVTKTRKLSPIWPTNLTCACKERL